MSERKNPEAWVDVDDLFEDEDSKFEAYTSTPDIKKSPRQKPRKRPKKFFKKLASDTFDTIDELVHVTNEVSGDIPEEEKLAKHLIEKFPPKEVESKLKKLEAIALALTDAILFDAAKAEIEVAKQISEYKLLLTNAENGEIGEEGNLAINTWITILKEHEGMSEQQASTYSENLMRLQAVALYNLDLHERLETMNNQARNDLSGDLGAN